MLTNGYTLIGHDSCCYGNADVPHILLLACKENLVSITCNVHLLEDFQHIAEFKRHRNHSLCNQNGFIHIDRNVHVNIAGEETC